MPVCVRRYRLYCLVLLLLALTGGCGVQEYEKKMYDSQSRLERWVEEGKVLGGPIAIPSRVVVEEGEKREVSIASIFLRLPKNIYTQNEPDPIGPNKILYVYTESSPGPVYRVGLAAGDQEKFKEEVLRNFPTDGKPPESDTHVRGLGRETPTTFKTVALRDAEYLYLINFWTGSTKVAVVYWVRRAQEANGKNLVEASLKTFAAGKDALEQREIFRKGSPVDRVPEVLK
jgi:hypothetical protein